MESDYQMFTIFITVMFKKTATSLLKRSANNYQKIKKKLIHLF